MRTFLTWVAIIGLGLLAAFVGWSCSRTPEQRANADQKYAEREAIKACRKAVDDDLQELHTRRLTREVCEQMESQFREKWQADP